jgi:hypothetical protein
LAQERLFREKAEVDPVNRDYWISEAIKWLDRANTPFASLVVFVEGTQRPAGGKG